MIKTNRIRQLPRNIWVLTGGSFLTDISSEMIVYLIPLFLANILGVRTVTIGLIEGVAETTASLLKVFSGRYSDRLGQRKWLTVSGYGLSTIAKPFLVLADSWTAVFAVRFTDRVGKGIRTAPRDALIADNITPEHRGLAFGLHRAGDTAGAAIGLLIALIVVWLAQGRDMTLHQATFRILIWISVIPAVLAVLLLIVGIQEAPITKTAESQKHLSWPELDRPFKHYLWVVALFALGNSADAFLVLRAQERGLPVLTVMVLLVVFNLIYAVLSGPASALSDKIGRRRLLVSGWLLYALLYAGFALAKTGGKLVYCSLSMAYIMV